MLTERFFLQFRDQDAAVLRRGYTGVYDCSPDLQPMLGPVPGIAGLNVAAGFSGPGLALSPVVGELLAEQIVDGRTSLVDLSLFSPSRFIENRPIVAQHGHTVGTLG